MKSKKQFPLVQFLQRSENDLKAELVLFQQAKKSVARLLNEYVDAVNFSKPNVALLEKAYKEVAKALFSGSSEIPSIRVSCGLGPIPEDCTKPVEVCGGEEEEDARA